MNDIQLNGPSRGCAISAEEFAASLAAPAACSGCACGGMPYGQNGTERDDCGCGYGGEQMVCYCRTVPKPAPVPEVHEGCCCKQSFRAALQLLCDSQIASLIDFDTAAFLTDT